MRKFKKFKEEAEIKLKAINHENNPSCNSKNQDAMNFFLKKKRFERNKPEMMQEL